MLLGCSEPVGRSIKTTLGLKSQVASNLHFGPGMKPLCLLLPNLSICCKVVNQTTSG